MRSTGVDHHLRPPGPEPVERLTDALVGVHEVGALDEAPEPPDGSAVL
jgi:hypothetical protein